MKEARALLADLPAATPDRPVPYRTTSGSAFETELADILLHVALHGAYHRGQVARALRDAGLDPVNTDYITWVRSL